MHLVDVQTTAFLSERIICRKSNNIHYTQSWIFVQQLEVESGVRAEAARAGGQSTNRKKRLDVKTSIKST